MALKRPWVDKTFQAICSKYSRRVAILVHKNVSFQVVQIKQDPNGRYVIVQAQVNGLLITITSYIFLQRLMLKF